MSTTSGNYGARRRSREMALQLLFQAEFLNSGFEVSQAREMLRRFVEDFNIDAEVGDYGRELFLGVAQNLKDIDATIQSHSSHWKVGRMGLVDLTVMRIAVFEIKFMSPAIPPNVAINEAIEVAKKYGSTESGSFVNGILDHVARTL